MKQGEITIAGKAHPVRFNMLAIERAFSALDIQDFSQLEKLNNKAVGKSMETTRIVAYEGIASGYKNLAVPCPFKSADDIAETVTNFNELTPIWGLFTEAVQAFFGAQSEGELTGAGELLTPSTSES